jgi:thiol-disulfide isomerase/thioredoxin
MQLVTAKEHLAILILLPAIALSACGSALSDVFPEAEILHAENQTAAADQSTPQDQSPTAELIVQSDSSAGSSVQELPGIVLGQAEFHASDPQTVALVAGKVQLVEFFAYWCAVCKAMAPTVHGLENMYGGQINFVYLDRDDPATLALQEQLGYIYQPHFFLIDENGTVLAQWRGYVDGQELQRALLAALGN